ncbi:MAG: LacI family DNA-binding transcriptional regulator [Hyphomicrobiales bacterium]
MPRPRSRKGAPGILEVAKRAGVSPATVSRYFNDPDIVKSPTRKRIKEAAHDLGYIRDRMASAMHNHFSGTIGLVVPTIDNAIFSELIQAFSAKLREYDRTMLIATHNYNLQDEVSIIRSLLERRIDAVAMIGLDHERTPLEMLASRGVPVLAAWNYRADSTISCIGADNFKAGWQVGNYLVENGHKDIALVFPPIDNNDRAYDRFNGALNALKHSPSTLPPNRNITSLYDIGTAKASVAELLSKNRPTALICGNDVIAQGALFACQMLGLRVPEDISLIGIGDFSGSAHMEPGLTTLRLPAKRIGELAAEKLCGKVNLNADNQIERIEIKTELIERGSVRKLK